MSFGFVPYVAAETTDKIGSNFVNKNEQKAVFDWIKIIKSYLSFHLSSA
jgi:hypothetical protein